MGCTESKEKYEVRAQQQQQQQTEKPNSFVANKNKYESFEMVQDGLREAGLESSNLIIAVDFTISNESAGAATFHDLSLHDLTGAHGQNPYQKAIATIGRTLEPFDDDKLIPAFGFGDERTNDERVFPFKDDGKPCNGFKEVLEKYNEIVPKIKLAGPTSFAPAINKAIEIVSETKGYNILVIIADGQVTEDGEYCTCYSDTVKAIVKATNYPLSIIVVGVGDGPWEEMLKFDNELPERRFDNFKFVNYAEATKNPERGDIDFAIEALQEVPTQYMDVRKLGLL
eukprot:TRINITY_DN14052_c0_g1_i1.p1 TRINITY_DN14052_c0_g1~~TRINITY_DN14052_c0_g1_i1.p1  ORF type:complete len:284 (-),score=98.16 TRINITY_DN14052_c0_g1_i1:22-873(-)